MVLLHKQNSKSYKNCSGAATEIYGGTRTLIITGDSNETVLGPSNLTVDGAMTESYKSNVSTSVAGTLVETIQGKRELIVNQLMSLTVSGVYN